MLDPIHRRVNRDGEQKSDRLFHKSKVYSRKVGIHQEVQLRYVTQTRTPRQSLSNSLHNPRIPLAYPSSYSPPVWVWEASTCWSKNLMVSYVGFNHYQKTTNSITKLVGQNPIFFSPIKSYHLPF